ncbi:carbohydrate ABC transporter permease [Pelagovum pacificum]|uniref:sn-glycerol-3-phosphate transport system permease protein UgpE n=1 Tax=Pelagovum pacificum TaxID=2588711 RepID=A0A5C5GIV1_9RHOB|nr:carbohydrate ABC transporter permease [Pelagovum pacificum]QQA42705.1 carbohydrate ABC transporter permease [Pelagovum pacificum]TNY34144.1 carbohydrate ABC transporter permease [Pelagovum pacificum]
MRRKQTLRWTALLVISLLWILPVASLILFSFAPPAEVLSGGIIPSDWTFGNYEKVVTDAGRGVSIPQAMWNSTVIMLVQVIGVLLLDVPAAYAFARLRFWGRDLFFFATLLTLMMPGILEIISLYEMMSGMGLVDTRMGVILPGLARVIGIFILRQFFRQVPKELEEAARMDGATNFQVFLRIMVPLAAPAITTVAIITALYSWNNFLWPLVITNTPGSMTVPVAVSYLSADTSAVLNYTVILAAAFFTSLPMIILFLFGQRWIVQGMRPTSGIK